MTIQWLDHSCFLRAASDGTRLLRDPFNDRVPYPPPSVRADGVTIRHAHGDHNHLVPIGGHCTIDSPAALALILLLRPAVTIPTHY